MIKTKTHQEIIKKHNIQKLNLKKDDEEPREETPFQRQMRLYKEKNPVQICK